MKSQCLFTLLLIYLFQSDKVLSHNLSDNTFDAIKDVHWHLDDDHDGNIDRGESADYMKTELHAPNESRQSSFHNQDEQISVDDLWKKWINSKVYQWKNDDVIHWLKHSVNLPEYEETFRLNKVDGKNIPRLATPKAHYVHKVLGVTNANHRKKIYHHASDIILFGIPEDQKTADKNFLAIKAVHAHLDDDQNGNIDVEESVEYLRDELKEPKRYSSLHDNDALISVDDLWETWQDSEVYNWTNDDIIAWLKQIVGLPQYEHSFRTKMVTGKNIPRMATDKSSYLQKELGVANPTDRQKIYLRATDLILFGEPKIRQNYFNDTVVLIIVIVSTLACLYAFRDKNRTRKQIEQMSKDMDSLQQAEQNLKEIQESLAVAEERLQSTDVDAERERKLLEEIEAAKKEAERLHQERHKNQEEKIKLSLVEQELSEVRVALAKAEAELSNNKIRSPKILQQWLQMTYKRESQHFLYKKQLAMTQMEEAKDACDKVNKTRRSVFGSLRLAHGETIDLVDQKILNARSALAEVTNDLQERQHRWRQIELLCNFTIVTDGLFSNMPAKITNVQVLPGMASLGLIKPVHFTPESFLRTDEMMREMDQNDIELESITRKQGSSTQTSEFDSSKESIRSNNKASSESPIQTSPIYIRGTSPTTDTNECNTNGNLPPHTDTASDNEIEKMKAVYQTDRSISDKPVSNCSPERQIIRANTVPQNMQRMAALNGNLRSLQQKGSDELSLSVEPMSSLSKSSEYLMKYTRNLNDQVVNGSDPDDISYLSDDSHSSSNSSNTKKKKKGIRKLFHRKQKIES